MLRDERPSRSRRARLAAGDCNLARWRLALTCFGLARLHGSTPRKRGTTQRWERRGNAPRRALRMPATRSRAASGEMHTRTRARTLSLARGRVQQDEHCAVDWHPLALKHIAHARASAHIPTWADRAVPVRCEGAPQLTSSGANRPRASARSDYWRCSSCSRSLTHWGSRSRPGLARAGTFGGSTGRPRPGLRGPGAFSRRRDLTGNKIRWPKLVEDLHEHGDGSDTM